MYSSNTREVFFLKYMHNISFFGYCEEKNHMVLDIMLIKRFSLCEPNELFLYVSYVTTETRNVWWIHIYKYSIWGTIYVPQYIIIRHDIMENSNTNYSRRAIDNRHEYMKKQSRIWVMDKHGIHFPLLILSNDSWSNEIVESK